MMASLSTVPTISRIIEELDGAYPGTNMLDIVTRLPWQMQYVKSSGVGGPNVSNEWGFVANTPEGVEGVYICQTTKKEPDKLASDQKLHLFFPEGRKRKLEVGVWLGSDFGKVLVQLSLGNPDFRFPVLGYPHPYEVASGVWKSLRTFIGPFKVPEGRAYLLEGQNDGRIFLSLMALDRYMQRRPEETDGNVDFAPFSMYDLSRRLETAVAKERWGD